MTEKDHISPYLEPLAALQRLIDRFNARGVIMGGIAVTLLARPRLTNDLDAMILLSNADIPQLFDAAKNEDLLPRITDAVNFAQKHRIVLLRHEASGTNIDISLGILPFEEEVIQRSMVYPVAGLSLRLPSPEDLIILKAVAHRSKDLLDIQEIIDQHPDVDRGRIRSWVKQFAEALEMPEVWEDIAGYL